MGRFYTNWYKKTSEKVLLINFLNYIKKTLNAMLYVAANRRLNSMPFATPCRWPIGQECMFVVFFQHGVKDCLWTAKSCVVLTKVNTVRRLELMMIVLLSKLVVLVKFAAEKMLKVTKVVCYSDLQIDSEGLKVVGWNCTGSKLFKKMQHI